MELHPQYPDLIYPLNCCYDKDVMAEDGEEQYFEGVLIRK